MAREATAIRLVDRRPAPRPEKPITRRQLLHMPRAKLERVLVEGRRFSPEAARDLVDAALA